MTKDKISYKVAIIGSRDFYEPMALKYGLHTFRKLYDIEHIVSGGAKGADKLGEMYADKYGIKKLIFLPDWKQFGRKAGFMRNKDIIENCDVVFAFWDMKSKGTEHSVKLSHKLKKKIFIYNYVTKKWIKKYE